MTTVLLGPVFRKVFDAFIEECVVASIEFNQEAQAFAKFLKSLLADLAALGGVPHDALVATLAVEQAAIGNPGDGT
jgi:hypothetical protein